MKQIFAILLCFVLAAPLKAQTMHTLVFINKSEEGRTFDRTAEFNSMTAFATEVSNAIGYRHNLRTHTNTEFTAKMALQEINNLNVQENDIVFFYYSGHGVNWDDDQWPHMAFLDEQYHETVLFNKLKEKCGKAKLTLCIAACCNMDTEGRNREQQKSLEDKALAPNLAKELFTGFSGKKNIIISSSIRGQYSISWSADNAQDAARLTLGAVYGISFRDIMRNVLSGNVKSDLTWKSVLSAVNTRTMQNTENQQLPQFNIEEIAAAPAPTPAQQPQQQAQTQQQTQPQQQVQAQQQTQPQQQAQPQQQSGGNSNSYANAKPSARVLKTWVDPNANIAGEKALGIHCDFTANHMNVDGGLVAALFYSKDGKILEDKNQRYSVDGLVAAAEDFGTNHEYSKINDEVVYIPYTEIHTTDDSGIVYAEINIYDYKNKKLIAAGDPIQVKLK